MRFAILFCVVVSAACADSPSSPSPVNAQVVLGTGETASVVAAGVRIRFEGVTGDSRCPGDAICIQGGDAIVHLSVAEISGNAAAAIELHTGSLRPASFSDLTIALENLSPYPFSSLPPIKPGDYRATLRLTR